MHLLRMYYASVTFFASPQEKINFFNTKSDAEKTECGEALFSKGDMMCLWNRFRRKRHKVPAMVDKWVPLNH